jgi:hypothetical protein
MMVKTKPSWPEMTGPLAEYVPRFRAELARLGYTPLSAACQLRLVAHLSGWMTAGRLNARDLDMSAAERYFAGRGSAGYANERTVEALGALLGYLRGLRAVQLPTAELVTETGLLLDRYAARLASDRGLAPRTVALNVRMARPFLQDRLAADLGIHSLRMIASLRSPRGPRSKWRASTETVYVFLAAAAVIFGTGAALYAWLGH